MTFLIILIFIFIGLFFVVLVRIEQFVHVVVAGASPLSRIHHGDVQRRLARQHWSRGRFVVAVRRVGYVSTM